MTSLTAMPTNERKALVGQRPFGACFLHGHCPLSLQIGQMNCQYVQCRFSPILCGFRVQCVAETAGLMQQFALNQQAQSCGRSACRHMTHRHYQQDARQVDSNTTIKDQPSTHRVNRWAARMCQPRQRSKRLTTTIRRLRRGGRDSTSPRLWR